MDEARLELVGEELAYWGGDGSERWRVAIAEILMVAEFVSTSGALGEDYFLEFGVVRDGEAAFLECVVPTGAEKVLEELAGRLGGRMRLKLFDEVKFQSRVVWPAELEGQPVFVVLDEDGRSQMKWMLWGKKARWHVSPKLVEWMKRRWDLSGMETG
ncbi:MAG: hypothetical protein V4555_10500, partial [Acidobacteriota bacterium]